MADKFLTEDRAQVVLGNGHPDRGAEALTERSRRRLDTAVRVTLRMPRSVRSELPERADVVHRQREPAEVQQRIQEHRPVAVAQHEAIAVGPLGMIGIDQQVTPPQHHRDVRHPHRHSGMSAVGSLDRIDAQDADGVDSELLSVHAAPTRPDASAAVSD